jgi:hypothetical protein
MGYYGMGHSMTGYYGDPSFWGALKGIVGTVASAYTGGASSMFLGSSYSPANITGGQAPPHAPTGAGMAMTAPVPSSSRMARAGGMIGSATQRWIAGHPTLSAAGAAGTNSMQVNPRATRYGTAAAASSGVAGGHYTRTGQWSTRRRGRMRVTNPKALRRALRRAHGFAKLAMRTIHLVHPQKKGRFGGFKKRRAHR